MTDADDAGLLSAFHAQMRRGAYTTAVATFTEIMKEVLENAEAQRREIEELRREVAEALKVIEPFAVFVENVDADGWISNIHRERISTWFGPSDFRAASAFAAKHGGRDD